MEKDYLKSNNNINSNNTHKTGGDGLLRAVSDNTKQTTSNFLLQWGNRKRLRCMKVQVKDDSNTLVHRTTVRVDRRVVRADKEASNQPITTKNTNQSNGYLNLRQRPSSPPPPPHQRVLRNSENSSAMRGQSNGGVRGLASPDRGAHHEKRAHTNHHHNSNHENNNKSGASSETAHDSKKGGSSSGSGEAAPPVWPPKFVIALTNKEKEEDFIAFKGSKLPQRPKKRAKFIQRTLNAGKAGKPCNVTLKLERNGHVAVKLVSPGAWLCDLTLERYEVREKKISKKRPRGLKAMGNMESDSE